MTKYIIVIMLAITACSTNQPPPTPTLDTPQGILQATLDQAIIPDVLDLQINPDVPAVVVTFDMIGNSLNVAHMNMGNLLCAIRDTGEYDGYTFLISGQAKFSDALGNQILADGVSARIQPAIIKQINCENSIGINWGIAAEYYEVHRLIDN